MAKATKVRYSGVGVYACQFLLSRVQSVSMDTDLSEEEVRELTNDEVREYVSQTPSVTVNIETNEYGSCRNLRALLTITGAAASDIINVSAIDGPSVDIGVMVEEDNVLTRTAIMNECYLSSIGWNFDVGGMATETFTLETDNKTWYLNDYAEAYSYNGVNFNSGGECTATSCMIDISFTLTEDVYLPVKQYVDGIAVTGVLTMADGNAVLGGLTKISWAAETAIASGTRYRTIICNTGTTNTTIPDAPSTSTIGGITRGMIDINLAISGNSFDDFGSEGTTNLLRVQSCGIDVDLSREALQELGHHRVFDRSLTLPVPVNITFNTLANDLEEWAKFTDLDWSTDGTTVGNSLGIDSFAKTAAICVRIFDAKDTEATRNLKKAIMASGIQITAESFGVDVGGNATQDFTAKGSNFLVSGLGGCFETSA